MPWAKDFVNSNPPSYLIKAKHQKQKNGKKKKPPPKGVATGHLQTQYNRDGRESTTENLLAAGKAGGWRRQRTVH
jgi:hypothetical protein